MAAMGSAPWWADYSSVDQRRRVKSHGGLFLVVAVALGLLVVVDAAYSKLPCSGHDFVSASLTAVLTVVRTRGRVFPASADLRRA